MRIDTVLFDLDGTLVDSIPLIRSTFKRVFEEMNIPWGNDDVMSWVGRSLKDTGTHFVGEEREPEFFKLYQHYYALEHDSHTRCYPGTVEMLERLKKQGFTLGVVTSKSTAVAQRSIDYLKLNQYISLLIGAQDVTRHKPQPDPILAALKKLNRQPEQTVYIGDTPFDIMAAKGAKTKSIGVTWGIADRKTMENHRPDAIIDNWDELDDTIALLSNG